MEDLFAGVAAHYDEWYGTPLGCTVDALEKDLFYRLARPQPGEKVLDAGCGTGRLCAELAEQGLFVTGIDRSEAMLAVARARLGNHARVRLYRGDIEALPLRSDDFHLVVAFTTLEFTPRPELALQQLWRVVRPGGRLVVAVLNRLSPWAWRRRKAPPGSIWAHAHFFTPWELIHLVHRVAPGEPRVWSSAVFIPPGAGAWLLACAWYLERIGRPLLRPFGALIVLRVDKKQARFRCPELSTVSGLLAR
ncbi:MAG: class I SAM-dependent methyltransferase [Bacillota bacterium]